MDAISTQAKPRPHALAAIESHPGALIHNDLRRLNPLCRRRLTSTLSLPPALLGRRLSVHLANRLHALLDSMPALPAC